MRAFLYILLLFAVFSALAAPLPPPGSPERLTDLRWLSRPQEGTRLLDVDADGTRKLERIDGGFLVLKVDGPGVLDAFATGSLDATLGIEADGQWVWSGTLRAATGVKDGLFAPPLVYWCGNAGYFLAPVGFRQSLRIVCDRDTLPRYLSYRTLPKGAVVMPASPDPKSEYGRLLTAAGAAWKSSALDFAHTVPPARAYARDFVLRPGQTATALSLTGSGDIVHLEFHCNPALTGTLREVVAEIRYDGATEPQIRLPLPELAGLPHPWTVGRWDGYNGTLAAGLQYPWYINTPRTYFPEATFILNLPLPYGKGVTITLVNRSDRMQFTGYTRAVVQPLSEKDAQSASRLCAFRAVTPITPDGESTLLSVPGNGQIVGLSLFTTGSDSYPACCRGYALTLDTGDGAPFPAYLGLLPLWFRGAYGGATPGNAVLNYPRYEQNYSGFTRHFLTDPLSIPRGLQLRFAAGTKAPGSPTSATAVALWYQYGTPFAAPALPTHAETLPYTDYGTHTWLWEAENLAPLITAHGGEVRVVDDVMHDYHPSMGKYLVLSPDQAGDYYDLPIPLPANRYIAVSTATLWGPNRGVYEARIISKESAQYPPYFPQTDAFFRGRAVGDVPMVSPILVGQGLAHRRDDGVGNTVPFCNPAPDGDGIIRFICQAKTLSSPGFLLALDRLGIAAPPPTAKGWRECEDWVNGDARSGLMSYLPAYGRASWSGWGALCLSAPQNGALTLQVALLTGPAQPKELHVKGCLGVKQGGWSVSVNGGESIPLRPGKDDQEIVEWTIPLNGVTVPGTFTVEFTCTVPAEKLPGYAPIPNAELALDAWTIK